MKVGRVVHFEKSRQFGFLETRIAAPEGRVYLKKYYFNPARVIYLAVDDIRVGNGVIFEASTKQPKNPKDAPFAINIQIFSNEAAAQSAFERYKLIEQGTDIPGIDVLGGAQT